MIKFFRNLFGTSTPSGLVPLTPTLSRIPFQVADIMCLYDSWIVGGAARYVVGLIKKLPKDYDFVIPKGKDEGRLKNDLENKRFGTWVEDMDSGYRFEPRVASTHMGGRRIIFSDQLILDVWFEDVATYVAEVPTVWDGLAIRLRTGAMVVSSELAQEMRNRLIENRSIRRHGNPERFLEHLDHQGLAKEYLKGCSSIG